MTDLEDRIIIIVEYYVPVNADISKIDVRPYTNPMGSEGHMLNLDKGFHGFPFP